MAVLLPDMTHAEVVNATLPHLQAGQMLLFAHGFSVHYGLLNRQTTSMWRSWPPGPAHWFDESTSVETVSRAWWPFTSATGQAYSRAEAYAQPSVVAVRAASHQALQRKPILWRAGVLCGGVTGRWWQVGKPSSKQAIGQVAYYKITFMNSK